MSTIVVSHAIADFFGGCVVANAVPHYVAGVSGRAFQTPFAKPPTVGLSSSKLNVAWATFNALLAAGVFWFAELDVTDLAQAGVVFAGVVFFSFFLADRLGRLHGGNAPASP